MISQIKRFFVLFILTINLLALCVKCELRVRRAGVGPKWPSRKIPYAFDVSHPFTSSNQRVIKDTLKEFEDRLVVNGQKCLEFVPRSNELSYIMFSDSGDCSSGIGYNLFAAKISLNSDGCLKKGTIMHEIMHRIGFDHEQSRYDRNDNINVDYDSIPNSYKSNFKINLNSNKKNTQDSPYDFYSILHYNSNALKSHDNTNTIFIKPPSLLGPNEMIMEREQLSSIDVIQIQRMYGCAEAQIQKVDEVKSSDTEFTEFIASKFESEAAELKIDSKLAQLYLQRSLITCGHSHYWPLEYPIVPDHHELYRTHCLKKKKENQLCKFTIECEGQNSKCDKVLFRNGVCKKGNSNTIKTLARIVDLKAQDLGKTIEKTFKSSFDSFKKLFG